MRIRRRLAGTATALCLTVAAAAGATPANADLPVVYSAAAALTANVLHPGAAPPGANDWSCRPSAAHPRPVVLSNGTFANMTNNWNTLAPLLKNQGYCVFAFNYGATATTHALGDQVYGLAKVSDSAQELATFVDQVRGATGAAKVDIVGHSQGGMMPRWYLKFLGGGAKVAKLVGLAPSNHGTTLWGLGLLASWFPGVGQPLVSSACPSCADQVIDSPAMQALNAGGDTQPGVGYTVIRTIYDEVVMPSSSQQLSGANVDNVTLQSWCPINFADHVSVAFDRRALGYVLKALDPAHAPTPVCLPSAPVLGG